MGRGAIKRTSAPPRECALSYFIFFFQAEDGIRDGHVTGVQTCALPIAGGADQGHVLTVRRNQRQCLGRPIFLDSASSHRLSHLQERNVRSEEHTSELQSRGHLVCRLLLEKKKNKSPYTIYTD